MFTKIKKVLFAILFLSAFTIYGLVDLEWYEIGNEAGKGMYLKVKGRDDATLYTAYKIDRPLVFEDYVHKVKNVWQAKNNWYIAKIYYHNQNEQNSNPKEYLGTKWQVRFNKLNITTSSGNIIDNIEFTEKYHEVYRIISNNTSTGLTLGNNNRYAINEYSVKQDENYGLILSTVYNQLNLKVKQKQNPQLFSIIMNDFDSLIAQKTYRDKVLEKKDHYFISKIFFEPSPSGENNLVKLLYDQDENITGIQRWYDESYPSLWKCSDTEIPASPGDKTLTYQVHDKFIIRKYEHTPNAYYAQSTNFYASDNAGVILPVQWGVLPNQENYGIIEAVPNNGSYAIFRFHVSEEGYYPIRLGLIRWANGANVKVSLDGKILEESLRTGYTGEHSLENHDFSSSYLNKGLHLLRFDFLSDQNGGWFLGVKNFRVGND